MTPTAIQTMPADELADWLDEMNSEPAYDHLQWWHHKASGRWSVSPPRHQRGWSLGVPVLGTNDTGRERESENGNHHISTRDMRDTIRTR